MKRITKFDQKLLDRLVGDYNHFSELVALNRKKMKEGQCDEGLLEWNRGTLNQIEHYLEDLVKEFGLELNYEYGSHEFMDYELEYLTVKLVRKEVER